MKYTTMLIVGLVSFISGLFLNNYIHGDSICFKQAQTKLARGLSFSFKSPLSWHVLSTPAADNPNDELFELNPDPIIHFAHYRSLLIARGNVANATIDGLEKAVQDFKTTYSAETTDIKEVNWNTGKYLGQCFTYKIRPEIEDSTVGLNPIKCFVLISKENISDQETDAFSSQPRLFIFDYQGEPSQHPQILEQHKIYRAALEEFFGSLQ